MTDEYCIHKLHNIKMDHTNIDCWRLTSVVQLRKEFNGVLLITTLVPKPIMWVSWQNESTLMTNNFNISETMKEPALYIRTQNSSTLTPMSNMDIYSESVHSLSKVLHDGIDHLCGIFPAHYLFQSGILTVHWHLFGLKFVMVIQTFCILV